MPDLPDITLFLSKKRVFNLRQALQQPQTDQDASLSH